MDSDISQQSTIVLVTPTVMLRVTSEGLDYQDDNGAVGHLDFADCRANWVAYVNQSDDFAGNNHTVENISGVGWRDWFDRPPYIELFSEPRTRFIFCRPRTWREWIWWPIRYQAYSQREAFSKLHHQIMAAGWALFDLG